MASAQELFHLNRKFPKINLSVDELKPAIAGIKRAFEPEVMDQLFHTAYAVWLEAVWQVVADPTCPTLFDGGAATFSRARELRLAGNLNASSLRLFTDLHRNPDGFHQTLHRLGKLKDAVEEGRKLPVQEILDCDSSDCCQYGLGSPGDCKGYLHQRIEEARQDIGKPLTQEELHGLRRGLFRDLMHAFQLLAMTADPAGKDYIHDLAAYQEIRGQYDVLDRIRKTTDHYPVTLTEETRASLLSMLDTVNEALC